MYVYIYIYREREREILMCITLSLSLYIYIYKDLKAKGLEVIFVSSDRDEDSFRDYYKDMPWLALDFSQRKEKELLLLLSLSLLL